MTYVSAANAYIYHPATSLELVGRPSWPTYAGRRVSVSDSGSLILSSVEDRSSSASKDEVAKEWNDFLEMLDRPDK